MSGVAPQGDGVAHGGEDSEGTRSRRLSAEGAGAGASDDDDERNSPLIIWRHAAPVKIVTNVPADLLDPAADGARASGGGSTALDRRAVGSGGGARRVRAPRAVASSPDPRRSAAAAALQRRMAYGVWYLPKDQWQARALGLGQPGPSVSEGTSGGAAEDGEGIGPGAEPTEGLSESDLSETIRKLHSSRIYKGYLKQEQLRIPEYLKRVETPKELSSKRVHIPMMGAAEAEPQPSA